MLRALEPDRVVGLRYAGGAMAHNLVTQIRTDGENKWLFIAHGAPDVNRDVPVRQDVKITLKGLWKPTLYDTLTGETRPLACTQRGGNTEIAHEMYDFDSALLLLEPGKAMHPAPVHAPNHDAQPVSVSHNLAYTLSEPNVLLLDVAELRLDEDEYLPAEEILRADNILRERLGWPGRLDSVAQPWVMPDEPAVHTVTMRFTIASEIDLAGAEFAIEDAELARFSLNGKALVTRLTGYFTDKSIKTVALPVLHKGINTLTATVPFSRRSNLEWCYLLGDFGVKLSGRDAVACPRPRTLAFGDCVPQGLPFYGANITYHLPFSCEAGDLKVHIPHYRGALLRLTLDGKQSTPIVYSPYDLVFRGVDSGRHKLDITLYGNRHNSFGALHNADPTVTWIGPDCWRSTGDRWCYEYRLRPLGVLSTPVVTLLR